MTPRQPGPAASAAQPRQIARRFATEVLLWYSLPAVFLLVYIHSSAATVQAVAPHFLVFTALLAALLLARLSVSALCPNATLSRLLSSLLVSAVLGSILLYYTLVLVGLHSWGGVIAWRVIPTCFAQAPHVADALGIPAIVTESLLPLAYAGLVAACWLYLKRFDWTRAAGARVSGWTGGIFIVCGFAILAVETYQFCATPWTEVSEPVSLTLFPQADSQELEGHHMDRLTAKNIDALEDAAREAYVPGATGERKNVVLIVVDALRPDHMGVYGYDRNTTPNLSRLAKEGTARIVTGMHSSCGDTICGLLSLVSSKFPRRFSFHPFTLQQAPQRLPYPPGTQRRSHQLLRPEELLRRGRHLRRRHDSRETGLLHQR
jgi:glucan phosphoethanolaminetransferase (alkaline phosphatase superfamily)